VHERHRISGSLYRNYTFTENWSKNAGSVALAIVRREPDEVTCEILHLVRTGFRL